MGIAGAMLLVGCETEAPKPATTQATAVAVAVPSQPGAVEGKTENSDQFIWELLTQFAAPASPTSPKPAVFETWASDGDTFNVNPHWPSGPEPLKFHPSVLQLIREGKPLASLRALHAAQIDVPCGGNPPAPPPGAAVGGFPTYGTPTPCIAEQVSRNRANYDYIVNNKFNTQAGLAAAYKNGLNVDFPPMPLPSKAIGCRSRFCSSGFPSFRTSTTFASTTTPPPPAEWSTAWSPCM